MMREKGLWQELRHGIGSRRITGKVDGLRLTVPARFARRYLRRGYEDLSLDFVRAQVGEAMIAVDVGAHVGFITCLMSQLVGSRGSVIALEPDAENAALVRRNLAANGLTAEVIPAAAGAQDGDAEFHVAASSDMNSLYAHPGAPTRRVVRVPMRRLDSLAPRVDFVKIDTEGAEIDVLRGMSRLFDAGQRPVMLVEWAPRLQVASGHRVDEIVDVLRDLDYELTVLDDRHGRRRSVDETAREYRALDMTTGGHGTNLACVPRRC